MMMSEEEVIMMKEVEAELNKIKSKSNRVFDNTKDKYCKKENIESCLKHLEQELDYLDINQLDGPYNLKSSTSTQNILCDVINSAFDLIDLYKEANREKDNITEKNCRFLSDVKTLKKTVDSLKKEITIKDKQIEINKEKHCMERIKNGELENKVILANREINVIQKENKSNLVRYKHEVKKVEETNRKLENKFRKDCGNYVSRDANTVAIIDKYKQNEEILKNTIANLKTTNESMLEEIINLKEKLSEMNSILNERTE